MFRLVLAEGRNLIRQRDHIEAQAEALLARDADAARLRELPGIGPVRRSSPCDPVDNVRAFH
jgi:transposase